mgnify:CR=1 FL=1
MFFSVFNLVTESEMRAEAIACETRPDCGREGTALASFGPLRARGDSGVGVAGAHAYAPPSPRRRTRESCYNCFVPFGFRI